MNEKPKAYFRNESEILKLISSVLQVLDKDFESGRKSRFECQGELSRITIETFQGILTEEDRYHYEHKIDMVPDEKIRGSWCRNLFVHVKPAEP